MEKGYKYIGFISLLLIPLTIIGFLKSYLGEFPNFVDNPGAAIHFHFFISAIWILLFILQPLLIYYKKIRLHKAIGRWSYLLFFLLLVSFIPLFIIQISYGYLPLTILTTFDILSLIFLYGLAIYHRKNGAIHMRYMISLVLVFALPSIGRINSHWLDFSFIGNMNIGFGLVGIFFVGLILKDKLNKQDYTPYLVALAGFIVKYGAVYLAYFFG